MAQKTKADREKEHRGRYHILFEDKKAGHKILDITTRGVNLAIFCLSVLLVVMFLGYLLTAHTPLRQSVPGYPTPQTRQAAMENLLKVDSLETVLDTWAFQVANIQRIVTGQQPLSIDPVSTAEPTSLSDSARAVIAANDSLLREELRKQQLNTELRRRSPITRIEGMHLFTPLKGVIIHPFSPVQDERHLDISAAEGSVVYAIADGTVLFTQWNDRELYSIVIQHDGGLVSICRHCGKLLCQAGDRVTAGTQVAVVGAQASGAHLHFELWYQGEAVDPALYIKF